MAASIPRIQSAHSFLVSAILIYEGRSQILEVRHIFKGLVSYLDIVILSCILITKYERLLSFPCIYFHTSPLTSD
jgi:hypothetical protein